MGPNGGRGLRTAGRDPFRGPRLAASETIGRIGIAFVNVNGS